MYDDIINYAYMTSKLISIHELFNSIRLRFGISIRFEVDLDNDRESDSEDI